MRNDWYEIWIDDSLPKPRLLILRPRESDGDEIEVLDAAENGNVVYRAMDYESAKLWLLEDEYTLVRGRMHLDAGA